MLIFTLLCIGFVAASQIVEKNDASFTVQEKFYAKTEKYLAEYGTPLIIKELATGSLYKSYPHSMLSVVDGQNIIVDEKYNYKAHASYNCAFDRIWWLDKDSAIVMDEHAEYVTDDRSIELLYLRLNKRTQTFTLKSLALPIDIAHLKTIAQYPTKTRKFFFVFEKNNEREVRTCTFKARNFSFKEVAQAIRPNFNLILPENKIGIKINNEDVSYYYKERYKGKNKNKFQIEYYE